MGLRLPRPLGGQCVKAAVRKKGGFGKGGHFRGYGPEAAKATERPMCKGSCKEKGWVWEGRPDYGNLGLRLPRPLGGQCVKASVRKKGGFGKGSQIRGIWP